MRTVGFTVVEITVVLATGAVMLGIPRDSNVYAVANGTAVVGERPIATLAQLEPLGQTRWEARQGLGENPARRTMTQPTMAPAICTRTSVVSGVRPATPSWSASRTIAR